MHQACTAYWRLSIPRLLFFSIAVTALASIFDDEKSALGGFLFQPVVSAQFALLGFLLVVLDAPFVKRLSIVQVGGVGLCILSVLRSTFNEWELLLSAARMILVVGVWAYIRRRHSLIFTDRELPSVIWKGFGLRYLLLFMSLVASLLGGIRFLQSDALPSSDILLVAAVVVIGIFAAFVPLVAVIGALGIRSLSRSIPYVVAILILAACMGYFGYSQTGHWRTALLWSLRSLLEAVTIAAAVLGLRYSGYRLANGRLETVDGVKGTLESC